MTTLPFKFKQSFIYILQVDNKYLKPTGYTSFYNQYTFLDYLNTNLPTIVIANVFVLWY